MRAIRVVMPLAGFAVVVCTLFAQRPFRQYPTWENYNLPLPPDWNESGEWTVARLMYPTTSIRLDWQSEYRRGFDWREGHTNWTIDYPRSDRHLAAAVRRLTRVHARSVEQPINLDDDDDDFHGTNEWEIFQFTMQKVFPDRKIVDIQDSDPIFHTVFDLDDRYQVPGMQFIYSGLAYEKGEGGKTPHW